MGLFDALGKMIQGKPVFEEPSTKPQSDTAPITSNSSGEPPVVMLGRTSCYQRGSDIEIQCDIRNLSSENVMLDKIRLLGAMRELDYYMKPSEVREFIIYRGPRPHDMSQHYAELAYKSENEQYWQAIHMIQYHQLDDRTFDIAEFKQQMPIRRLR